MLSQEVVRNLFDYNTETGELVRLVAPHSRSRSKAGSIAGCKNGCGYFQTGINGKLYLNHRIIWIYVYGYNPELDIDHINRIKTDNRIENLREVSRSCNLRNKNKTTKNTSRVQGVHMDNRKKLWMSRITNNGKNKFIGYFDDFTEAVAHRLCAEQCLEGWPDCNSITSAAVYMNKFIKGEQP
jgi:hypothetical protein